MIKAILVFSMFFNVLNASDNFLEKKFPTIEGISLSGNDVKFPDVLIGKPSVLAIAFKQKAQLCINSLGQMNFFLNMVLTKMCITTKFQC